MLERLYIERDEDTPLVHLDASKSLFQIAGMGLPENCGTFFHPIFVWMDTYVEMPNEKSVLDVDLAYYNTAFSKCLFDLLEAFASIQKKEKGSVMIRWHYLEGDVDLLSAGKELEELLKVPFEFIEEEDDGDDEDDLY